jgi:hypothetical protein
MLLISHITEGFNLTGKKNTKILQNLRKNQSIWSLPFSTISKISHIKLIKLLFTHYS